MADLPSPALDAWATFEAAYYALVSLSSQSPDDADPDSSMALVVPAQARSDEAALDSDVDAASSYGVANSDALLSFLKSKLAMLRRPWKPYAAKDETSKCQLDKPDTVVEGNKLSDVDDKHKKSAATLSSSLGLAELDALRIVLTVENHGVVKGNDPMLEYTRFYFSETSHLIKLVALLFEARAGDAANLFRNISTDILTEQVVEGLIGAISQNFTSPPTSKDDPVSALIYQGTSTNQLHLINLLFIALRTVAPPSADLLSQWLDIVTATNFFTDILEWYAPATREPLGGLTVLVTLALLDLEQDIMEPRALSYLRKPEVLIKIHASLHTSHSPSFSPVLLAWSLVLHRISLWRTDTPDPALDGFLLSVLNKPQESITSSTTRVSYAEAVGKVASQLFTAATSQGALNMIPTLLDALPKRVEYASVCATLLQASLPYTNMVESFARIIYRVTGSYSTLVEAFFLDEFADRSVMLAKAKMPAAIAPFVVLARTLGTDAYPLLAQMSAYMHEIPKNFRDYDFLSDKPNHIELTAPLELLPARSVDNAGAMVLPIGTHGDIIYSTGTTIVMWKYEYSGWAYMGRLLELAEETGGWSQLHMDIVSLITSTIVELQAPQGHELLENLSSALHQSDIVELIARRLDEALFTRNIDTCILAVEFLTALTVVDPHKVWPYLGRTKMLERNGRGGLLGTLLGAVEIVNNDFEFTLRIVTLVEKLVKDTLSQTLDTTVSSKVRSEVLGKFTRHLLDVFESFAYWRYNKPEQRVEIATRVIRIFHLILQSTYRADDATPVEKKVTSVLSESAKLLTAEFLTVSENAIRTLKPLLGVLESVAQSRAPLNSTSGVLEETELSFARHVLRFCALVVRVRSILRQPCSYFERKLYSQSPDLVLIFARYGGLHENALDLLEAMISGYWPDEQPSLLAHLGPEYSQLLISYLSGALKNPLELGYTTARICSYLSSIILSKQEGLAILLLSGRDTRDTDDKTPVTSLLEVLETTVSDSTTRSPALVEKMLDSIALAHSTWTLAATQNRQNLYKTLIELVKDANAVDKTKSAVYPDEIIRTSHVLGIGSRAIRIMSVELFKSPCSPATREITNFLKADRNLTEFSTSFLNVDGLRSSLLGNLERNFNSKWPKTPLQRYTRSAQLTPRAYGDSYLYDLGLLDTVLSHEPVWTTGYRKDVVEANANLSFIDAQMNINKAWCSLLTSLMLSSSKNGDKEVFGLLGTAAMTAVEANMDDKISVPLFAEIIKLRLDLAFYIMFHMSKAHVKVGSEKDLATTFSLLLDPTVAFLSLAGTPTSPSEQPRLYRQLLKIISLQLDNISVEEGGSFQFLQTIQGILDTVVIRGMKAVSVAVQSNPSPAGVEDIVQITMILRKCLKVRGITALYPNIIQQMNETGCAQSAMALFSYCPDLCITEGDPIFGELALIYLLEWLSVDTMADHLVMNGLFRTFTETPVAQVLQEGVVRPSAYPRLFGIWTKGMLTIVLELLRILGQRIAPEVEMFLKFYSVQIESALDRWVGQSVVVSLSTIEETYQLYLLVDIIEGLADAPQTLAMPQTKARRGLVDAIDYLLSHHKFLASRVVVTTAEEQRLAVAKDGSSSGLTSKVIAELTDLREFLDQSYKLQH